MKPKFPVHVHHDIMTNKQKKKERKKEQKKIEKMKWKIVFIKSHSAVPHSITYDNDMIRFVLD